MYAFERGANIPDWSIKAPPAALFSSPTFDPSRNLYTEIASPFVAYWNIDRYAPGIYGEPSSSTATNER